MQITCMGQGSPTVVLDAGLGDFSAQWVRVQREVSDTTRVCAYDRAGMDWSEMGPEPRDAKQVAGELHTLLEGAGIDSPYVLVGHSFGRLYTQTYAARYPDQVAGVALIAALNPSTRQISTTSQEFRDTSGAARAAAGGSPNAWHRPAGQAPLILQKEKERRIVSA